MSAITTSIHADEIRARFARALSEMYKQEVPQYGTLLDLVAETNALTLEQYPALAAQLSASGQLDRLDIERHGAIRLGTAEELATIARAFALMGMYAVGYYDLSQAGVPVHATAFRPLDEASLRRNPFRVFTSLLRLDLLDDQNLSERAAAILNERRIFTPRGLALLALGEQQGGFSSDEADEFVLQILETFRWHHESTADVNTYRELRAAHPLVADVVCFKGPHINHLTPRVLDIDEAQAAMQRHNIRAKASIEGPPRREVPILLRQTSFLALEEPIYFRGGEGRAGSHTARFGEIEQRGCALTPKGRALYDRMLEAATHSSLKDAFADFPDDLESLRKQGLTYFTYRVTRRPTSSDTPPAKATTEQLIESGWLRADPLIYEDFLPVSAAGIFRSNLGAEGGSRYEAAPDRPFFEAALGSRVRDEFELYEAAQSDSLAACLKLFHSESLSSSAAQSSVSRK